MDFSSNFYLPKSEERIAALRKLVGGRPVAILAAGPSIENLEKRIEELRHKDICYFGLNQFFVQETYILGKIEKNFSGVMCSSRDGMPLIIKPLTDFLKRNEENMLISSFWGNTFELLDNNFRLNEFLQSFDKKLLFFNLNPNKNCPNIHQPLDFIQSNSLLILIQLALIGKAESIILFGADGHVKQTAQKYYYRQNEYSKQGWAGINESLINDTKHYFNALASSAIKNTCQTYNLSLVNILNCSLQSFYTPFQKISYDDAFEYLLKGKKTFKGLDLRRPMQPKKQNDFSLIIQKIFNFSQRQRKNFFKEYHAKSA